MVSSITQKLTIDMIPEYKNQGYEKKIESLIGSNIEYEIRYRVDDYQDWNCTGQQVECDPLVGGIKIYNDDGTIGGEPGCPQFCSKKVADNVFSFFPKFDKCIGENIEFMKHPETGEMILNLDTAEEFCTNSTP